MRFKAGDRVKIRTDLENYEQGNSDIPLDDDGKMLRHAGESMTIKRVGSNYYLMEEYVNECAQQGGWYWAEDMIEGLAGPRESYIIINGERINLKEMIQSGL